MSFSKNDIFPQKLQKLSKQAHCSLTWNIFKKTAIIRVRVFFGFFIDIESVINHCKNTRETFEYTDISVGMFPVVCSQHGTIHAGYKCREEVWKLYKIRKLVRHTDSNYAYMQTFVFFIGELKCQKKVWCSINCIVLFKRSVKKCSLVSFPLPRS